MEGGSILVSPGGTLIVHDSDLNGSSPETHWSFQVYGRIEMSNSSLSGSGGLMMRYAATIGSQITDSHLHDNHPRAVYLASRAELAFTDNTVTGNTNGLDVNDATAHIKDNVFVGNSGFAVLLYSTVIGSRLTGPVIANVEGNAIGHGGGGMHFQEGYERFVFVHENLFTNLTVGLRLQGAGEESGQADFSENSIVDNHVAAANFGQVGHREALNEITGYHVDLGDSWLGEAGATWDPKDRNNLQGPFHTDQLADHDPVTQLWPRLESVKDQCGC